MRALICVFGLAALVSVAASCGGSSSPGAPGPSLQVIFPPPVSLTDAPQVTVRGTASSPEGVTVVEVNGIAAISSDGFATWEAIVPLALGDNALSVLAQNGAGASTTLPLQIRREGRVFGRMTGAAWESSTGRLFLLEIAPASLVVFDEATATSSVVSGAGVGVGPGFINPTALALDSANARSFVADPGMDAIVAVDHATGDRSILSNVATGTGPTLGLVVQLVLDSAQGRLIALEGNEEVLLAVDLATGNRSLLSGTIGSDPTAGTGPDFENPSGLALDPATGTLFVCGGGFSSPRVLSVDPATGNRTILSDDMVGTGTGLELPTLLALSMGDLLVYDFLADRILSVSLDPLTSGDRSVVADDITGTGPNLQETRALVVDDVNGRALAASESFAAVLSVDLSTGDRTDFWRPKVGSGEAYDHARGVAVHPTTGLLYLVNSELSTGLLVLNPLTGARSVLSGGGQTFLFPGGLAIDVAQNQALFVASALGEPSILSADLAGGSRTVVSGGATGSGPAFEFPREVVFDAVTGLLYTVDRGNTLDALLSVNPSTGERAIVSNPGTGVGPIWDSPYAVALHPTGDPAFVAEIAGGIDEIVFSVDPLTGDRTEVAGALQGTGHPLGVIWGLAFEPGSGDLLALLSDALVSIDVATGDRVEISSPLVGAGPTFFQASSNEVLTLAGQIALVASEERVALIAVDIQTGERVIIAK